MKRFFVLFGILVCLLTFFLRIPSFFTPFDSAYEYLLAFLGRQVFKGGGFYSTPWSMKPPGEPLTYGILYLLAGLKNWELSVRIFTSVLNSLASLVIFLLGRKIVSPVAGLLAAFFWAIFSSGGTFAGTSAYAEMFMPFFTVLGIYIFFVCKDNVRKRNLIFFAGLSLGISLLYKQSALFDFLPIVFFVFLEKIFSFKKFSLKLLKEIMQTTLPLIFGFVLPLTIFVVYILIVGKFSSFYDWAIYKPYLYGKLRTNSSFYFKWMWKDVYIVWVLAALGAFISIIRKKEKGIFLFLWFLSGLGTLFISGKYWNYYFLQIFIPACLLASFGINELLNCGRKLSKKELFIVKNIIIIILAVSIPISLNFPYYKKIFYRFIPFLEGKITRNEYRLLLSEGEKEKDHFQAAEFLKKYLKNNEKIFVWDGSPPIYVLADVSPIYPEYIWNPQFWYQTNDWIGFIFSPSSENVESSKKGLIKKLLNSPPDYIILAVDPVKDIFLRVKEFPEFFSFTFANYHMKFL